MIGKLPEKYKSVILALSVTAILSLWHSDIYSQLYINEFLASNATIIEDPDYGDFADWLEIYNAGDETVNLNGFYITDNLDDPEKWQIQQDIYIAPGGFVIIWADDYNSGVHTNYKLAQEGEEIGLYSPGRVLIDSVTYKLQMTDISRGRENNGSSEWAYFSEPTPGSSNSTTAFIDIVDNVPEFSTVGGIYNSPVTVELSTYMGGTIRYTTDCSEPEESSPVYSSPITINSTTIVRTRIYKENQIPGPVVTHTYFINEDIEPETLPVISIASNHENFWDPVVGIYVQDFKPEWEVPINIELFENNGSDRAAFNERAGTKINGLNSWQLPQKMLGIYFRKQYGNNKLEYPLFFDRERDSFKSFALRASGSDWSYTLFRDGMIQISTHLNMNLDDQGFRPCIVYINGQYMGIHNIREKVDDDFIEEDYGLEAGTFDLVENENYAEAGDLDEYNEFLEIHTKDLSVQENYDEVVAIMDIENFTDYICTEICSRNTSVNHNTMAWKPKGTGKWKWILMDLDRGFFNPSSTLISYYTSREVMPFKELMGNQGYREYFGKRLANHLYTTFNPIRIKKLIDKHQQMIESEMPDHIARWLGTTSSYGDAIPSLEYWYEEVNDLKTFAESRPGYILADLMNYGFSETANLRIAVSTPEAGYVTIGGLDIPEPSWSGPYLKDLQTRLTAIEKPGYTFQGWSASTKNVVVPRGSIWKYMDDGSDQGTAWRETGFNDSNWNSGQAQLGYGDGDEVTTVSYGGSSSNKFITTYFRHTFQVTEEDLSATGFMIDLLRDDGAVVYLNGQEIIRSNMNNGSIDYLTTASSSMGEPMESEFSSFEIDSEHLLTGNNVLAVEIHQASPSSSDIGFDLELVSYKLNSGGYISTNKNYNVTLTEDLSLVAVYESNGQCILPIDITENMTLSKDCSPYVTQGDITVHENVTVMIEKGVELWIAPDANIFINGNINATGTPDEPVIFRINPAFSGKSWGALCFINTSATSNMTYVTIEDASKGPLPIRDVAAISAFKADLVLDHITIENIYHNPIAARYSDVILTNSTLHSEVTGDLINVKYGNAVIENCEFRGNDKVDTDAIDYDDVENGVIRNCKIYSFYGLNSDAVDIGEVAKNIQIDSLLIYNITDKGVSVGQKSTATIKNSTFVNCNMGVALKDSCRVIIDYCTFYSNGAAIACFEKNPGSAGGNGIVTNSILSNCSDTTYFADSRSTINISYCLSDNDGLPDGQSNLFGDPLFVNPTDFDFRLKPGSPCINEGSIDGTDMGTMFHKYKGEASLMISGIFYNQRNDNTKTEFLTLYNPGSATLDISGYKITQGINYTFPEGSTLGAGVSYLISKYPGVALNNPWPRKYAQWSDGNLANEGEIIRLEHKSGIVLDYVNYQPDEPWPVLVNGYDVLIIEGFDLDNHFPGNWTVASFDDIITDTEYNYVTPSLLVYPNPAENIIFIKAPVFAGSEVNIFSITGKQIAREQLDASGFASIDLSSLSSSILIIKVGNIVEKIVLMRP